MPSREFAFRKARVGDAEGGARNGFNRTEIKMGVSISPLPQKQKKRKYSLYLQVFAPGLGIYFRDAPYSVKTKPSSVLSTRPSAWRSANTRERDGR